jgi:hypothetical protein
MTVSQEHDILWEPDDPREAVADTLASLRVDGLELDEFGLAVMQRIADGELDHDRAVAEILARYRA